MLKRPHRRVMVDLLIEALLIVFSVMLALEASQWRTQHEARQRLDAAEQHICIELRHNRAILQDMIPYHEAEVRRIGQFLARRDLDEQVREHSFSDMADQLTPRGFWNPTVSPQDLSESAWQSALSDRSASHMNPPLLNKLTAYYALQRGGVQRTLQFMLQQALAPPMFDPHSTLLMLRASQGWFSEIAAEEKMLLARTNDALNALPVPAGTEAVRLQRAKRAREPYGLRGSNRSLRTPVAGVLLVVTRRTEHWFCDAVHWLEGLVCAGS